MGASLSLGIGTKSVDLRTVACHWPETTIERRVDDCTMTYEELNGIAKGQRLLVFDNGQWKPGTFERFIPSADPAMWFAFDERQQHPGGMICTKVFTGQQFTEEYWNHECKDKKFQKMSEDSLNLELIEKMGANA